MSAPSTWQPLRLDEPSPPALPGDSAVTVALVASAGTAASGWAPRAAAALARGWADHGQATYLCDLDLEAPALHDVLGLPNDEGVNDCLAYGASVRRVAHRVAERLYLASAGTVSADPAAVLASPRWGGLVDAFHEAGALLVVYLPAQAAGAEAMLARADAVIVLRGPDEAVDLGEARERFLTAFGPHGEPAGGDAVPGPGNGDEARVAAGVDAAGVAGAGDAGDTGDAAHEAGEREAAGAMGDDVRVVGGGGGVDSGAEASGAAEAADDRMGTTPPAPPPSAEPPEHPGGGADATLATAGTTGRGGRTRWVLLLAVVVVLILLLAAAMGWLDLPGLGPRAASATQVAARGQPAPVAAATPAPDPHDGSVVVQEANVPLQAWALTLEAHQDEAAAYARVRELREHWPDLLFWLAPVRVRDERFHRVLAGPATTRDEVEALRGLLGGDARWIAREAGCAFRLGEMAEYATARTWTEVLEEMGVPTHVLALPAADGSRTYQVYAGAYASSEEALELADILRGQDLGSAPLVERRGIKPE